MFAALASNDPPEVVSGDPAELLKLANDGLIVPITDMVEEQASTWRSRIPPRSTTSTGKACAYSMPMPTGGGITGMILINKDMFEAAGWNRFRPRPGRNCGTWAASP